MGTQVDKADRDRYRQLEYWSDLKKDKMEDSEMIAKSQTGWCHKVKHVMQKDRMLSKKTQISVIMIDMKMS